MQETCECKGCGAVLCGAEKNCPNCTSYDLVWYRSEAELVVKIGREIMKEFCAGCFVRKECTYPNNVCDRIARQARSIIGKRTITD